MEEYLMLNEKVYDKMVIQHEFTEKELGKHAQMVNLLAFG